ncbi:MAG TPA: serine/threonine-protein kinase [Kofleriaceae bacterium]|nr:serine/threonine-protein kinase [Kofleriaceae bacterium]
MPEPSAPGMPQRVGRYEVITHLATGGMAQIYLARQSGLGAFERHVVLKTILRERATDQRFVTMFLDEAKLAATLNHQNIAQVYEVDQADGAYFMAMEYVHGENARAILETTLRRGWTIPLELAVMIVSGAAAGLHHAHERRGKNGQPLNIVHRDVSPANIMVGYDGSVKVLDFGIAKAEERATKTVGGTIKGKYGYMSPEQCKGKPIDRRSDIFALGICLYELTTLRRAFKGNDDFETMKRIVAGDVLLPSVAVPGYPRELEAIVLTAMANDPNARFQSGQEMIEALDAFAVRAKLTGSNTAMGRFMVQLFGSKKEPWIEAPSGSDRTQVTEPSGEMDPDNDEKTTLIESKQQPEYGRAATATAPGTGMGPQVGRQSGEVQSLSASAAAADWNHDSRAGRHSSPRPGFDQPRTPPNGYQLPNAAMTSTLAGTGPVPAIPGRIPSRAETEPGSKPLVDDRLAWQQPQNPAMRDHRLPPPGATRLPTQYQDPNFKITSNRGWIILAILMLAGLGAGVLIAMQSS